MVKEATASISAPIVLFTYYNPIMARGLDKFCKQAKEAGAAGGQLGEWGWFGGIVENAVGSGALWRVVGAGELWRMRLVRGHCQSLNLNEAWIGGQEELGISIGVAIQKEHGHSVTWLAFAL